MAGLTRKVPSIATPIPAGYVIGGTGAGGAAQLVSIADLGRAIAATGTVQAPGSSIPVPVTYAFGGTGLTAAPANGQLPIGNGSGYTLGTLTAGQGISITNAAGAITVAANAYSATPLLNSSGAIVTDSSGNDVFVVTSTTAQPGAVQGVGGSPSIAVTGSADLPTISLVTPVTVADGGTGQTTYTDGQLLIGDSSTGGLDKATLTAGTWMSVTNGPGSITVSRQAPKVSVNAPTGNYNFSSTTYTMVGTGVTLTPTNTGSVLIIVNGNCENSSGTSGVNYGLNYGTGTAPATGAAQTGTTKVTGNTYGQNVGATCNLPMTFVLTGLVLNTAYWFDVEVAAGAAGNSCVVDGVTIVVLEL